MFSGLFDGFGLTEGLRRHCLPVAVEMQPSGPAMRAKPPQLGLLEQDKESPMSKKEIIDAMADAAEITKEKAGSALDALTSYIEGTLKSGDEVNFAPLGKFKVTDRAAREGRNPMSGEKIKIPASKVPKFTASKQLKEGLNPKKKK
ncbi:MAG: DNA-binding protein HU-beta [Hyphomicrobiaceae bacterium]